MTVPSSPVHDDLADTPDPTEAVTAEPVTLRTTDGLDLEAEIAVPASPAAAAVLAHPHPTHGGSMRSLVTSELFRLLPASGVAVVRFNFRSVEGSGGVHDGGRAEQSDIAAAVELLSDRAPGVPLVTAGWSFGADVSLAVTDARIGGWFCIAPPLRTLPPEEFHAATDPRPKCLAIPEHDQFLAPAAAREATRAWVHTGIEVVAGADHFCAGRTDRVARLAVTFAQSLNR